MQVPKLRIAETHKYYTPNRNPRAYPPTILRRLLQLCRGKKTYICGCLSSDVTAPGIAARINADEWYERSHDENKLLARL
jgi:hypothetical protein